MVITAGEGAAVSGPVLLWSCCTALEHPPRRPLLRDIMREVAARHGLTVAQMLSKRRTRPLVHARHEVMWEARRRTALSYPHIAELMGFKDHTSIIHGERAHAKRTGGKPSTGEALRIRDERAELVDA